MKACFYWVVGSLLVPAVAQAQVGVRVGGNVAGLQELGSRNAFDNTTIPGLGYQAGVYYTLALGRHWLVQPEVQFSRESQQLRKEGYGYDDYYTPTHTYLIHDYRVSLSFLNVPVLVRRTLGPVYVEAGPQASVLVGGRGRGETRQPGGAQRYLTREDIDQAATAYFNRVDAGVCVGVGLRLPAGWGVSLRAYQGLTRLTGDPHGYQYAPQVLPPSGTEYRRLAQVALTRDLWGPGGVLH